MGYSITGWLGHVNAVVATGPQYGIAWSDWNPWTGGTLQHAVSPA
jgi:hypothetical protein